MQQYLKPSRFVDSDHPGVIEFALNHRGDGGTPLEQAVALYYAVRDGIRYNPYVFSRDPQTLKGSHALESGQSYCVPKATLLAACARHCGIPARIGLADVKNHLATPRLLELLRSEVFAMHGYTELFLEGRWVKATPAFDIGLCEPSACCRWSSTGATTASSTRSIATASGIWSTCATTGSSPTCPRRFSSVTSGSVTRICSPVKTHRCRATCAVKQPKHERNR